MPTHLEQRILTTNKPDTTDTNTSIQTNRQHLPFRIGMLLIGTAAASFGIALTTLSGLGTTPISSVPWTLTAITGLSFGTTTFLINLVFYVTEVLLLGKSMPKWNILQIPAVLVFGAFIDLSMALVKPFAPTTWFTGLCMSLIGNVWLAAGIFLQVRSKTLVQPGEGAVLAISVVTRKAFGSIKVFFDCFLVLSAAVLGFFVLNEIVGIREGTLISADLVGSLVKGISKLFPEKKKN